MEWITVPQYAKRKNVCNRTVYRMIGRGEVRAEKVGRQWRIGLAEPDHLDQSGYGHQDYIIGQLIGARMELTTLSNPFPTVWDGYRPDASNHLKWRGEDGKRGIEWRLRVEEDPGWKFAGQHLSTGLPNAFKSLQEAKELYGRYCLELITMEDRLREEVGKIIKDDPETVNVNESHFFRSILSVLDQQSPTLGEEAYPRASVEGGVEVSYSDAWLFTAFEQDKAREWISRHVNWRRQIDKVHKGRIDRLRRDLVAQIDMFAKTIHEVDARGRVPGTCDYCPKRP
jgi:excisionase family DNA binding protein